MSPSLDPETRIVMAYARLKGMRDHVPTKSLTGTAPDALVNDFNRALDDLKSAGYDLSNFRITTNEMVELAYGSGRHAETALLQSRIDAVLIYFRITEDPDGEGPVKARIGFEAPKP
jgi:hypothetical protein